MHRIETIVGFDLKSTKNYATPESARKGIERFLSRYSNPISVHVLVVAQRTGGMGTDAEDTRYVPLVYAIRPDGWGSTHEGTQIAIDLARAGFHAFS